MDNFPVASEIAYLKKLVGAGWGGVAKARQERTEPLFKPVEMVLLTPAAIGAALGALAARWIAKRKSASTVAMAGLIGGVVAGGAAVAWASRGLFGPAARGAVRGVNAVRDERWLKTNPIDYA